MTTTTQSPAARALSAEATLLKSVHRTADTLDAIATDKIEDAVVRLELSALSAKSRLRLAAARAVAAVAEVCDLAAMIADDLLAGLEDEIITLPVEDTEERAILRLPIAGPVAASDAMQDDEAISTLPTVPNVPAGQPEGGEAVSVATAACPPVADEAHVGKRTARRRRS